MSEPALIHRQRDLLHDLYQLVADRAAAEPAIEATYRAKTEALEKELHESRQTIEMRYQTERETAEREYLEARQRIISRYEAEQTAAQKEHDEATAAFTSSYEAEKQAAENEYQEGRWTITAVLDGSKNGAESELKELRDRIAGCIQRMDVIRQEARGLLREWRQDPDQAQEPEPGQPDEGDKDQLGTMNECVAVAEDLLGQLKDLAVPKLLKGFRLVWLLAPLCLAALVPAYLLGQWIGLVVGVVAVLVLSVLAALALLWVANSQVRRLYLPLCQALAEGQSLRQRCEEQIQTAFGKKVAEVKKQHDRDLRQAKDHYIARRTRAKQRRNKERDRAKEKFDWAKTDSQRRHDTELEQEEKRYRARQFESKMRHDAHTRQVEEKHAQLAQENEVQHTQAWHAMANDWEMGMARVRAAVAEVNEESGRLFPPWRHPAWDRWAPPAAVPPGVRFGEYAVRLADIPNAIPSDERLRKSCPDGFTLPALLGFPERCSVLLRASDDGRNHAVLALQAVMLRFLTTFPPGKVRFTIIDPVGLGENFAAFMHLADFDEHLVASRIWTEQQHIEQRLTDLTAHMENVIQKYLRNQFQTIEEYNAHAGEVAEPFRILVVANFPANFSIEAMRRLVSVVSSGPRCGVYTLLSVDTKQPLPQGFTLGDLEPYCENLAWKDGRFTWRDEDFGRYAIKVDGPPTADFCTRLLHIVGEKAKDANRVEVPFEFITPPGERWWAGDSRSGINVPFGRAGATKRQHLNLGKGTAQHVLIAGKTGSGKSTLLHALITNLSLIYSPDEVELFLIDFKKGVEFKTYATHELPHARIVAIESEREFGLSVLQRLDAELKLRGDKFREVGAQDVASYRQAMNNALLPRILLIVDEFQEFFTEDDKIAQEAAQLLDRLVRQGRAFGLHVLLGSQTLGGAYTLARSTIDQMAVRIALQCSEADAHLILSDDNSAARLLSRPGEAIYNDANGLVEGNNPFQVVWLSEERREDYLRRLQLLDRQKNQVLSRPQIVFEGNAPADVGKNHLLNELLLSPSWPAPRAFHAWLGEAMAIKDPTSAVFRRQSGSNLLIVGQHDEAALGILATSLISLAAQHAPAEASLGSAGARFYVIDGTLADAPHAGFLSRLADIVPHPLRVVGHRELPTVIGELADEAERRQRENDIEAPTLYLLIYGLHRFRDLRRSDDDFGFGSREEKPSPAKQFASLLREGAGLGVHTLAWCDTLNNLNRSLDRQGLREFEMRVLFQMSVQDSSNLIDTPAASKLGLHRALFSSEEQGRLEKFRPYGVPATSWFDWVQQQLRGRQPVAVGEGTPV